MSIFGWLLLIGGAVGLVRAVQGRGSTSSGSGLPVAASNFAAGAVAVTWPTAAAKELTPLATLLFCLGARGGHPEPDLEKSPAQ